MIQTGVRALGYRFLYSEDLLGTGRSYDGVRVVNPVEEGARS